MAAVLFFFVVGLGVAYLDGVGSSSQASSKEDSSTIGNESSDLSKDPQETASPETEEDVSKLLSGSSGALYDENTNTYSFSYNDYDSIFNGTQLSDSGSGLKSGTISRNGQNWNIYCYSNLNSCSVSTSNGTQGNVYCYDYTNSCTYSDTNGNYASTHCYEYINSCTSTNSDGRTTNTYCYDYINSCNSSTYGGSSSYDSYGSSSSAYGDYGGYSR